MKKDFTLEVNQKYIYKQKMSCMYIYVCIKMY